MFEVRVYEPYFHSSDQYEQLNKLKQRLKEAEDKIVELEEQIERLKGITPDAS